MSLMDPVNCMVTYADQEIQDVSTVPYLIWPLQF